MKHALLLVLAFASLFMVEHAVLGFAFTFESAFGVFAAMAALISGTFLWLHRIHATPLALGMAVGWAGSATVCGWWWIFILLDRPDAMREHPAIFLALSLYFAGAILHLVTIARSMDRPAWYFAPPVALIYVLCSLVVRQL